MVMKGSLKKKSRCHRRRNRHRKLLQKIKKLDKKHRYQQMNFFDTLKKKLADLNELGENCVFELLVICTNINIELN
jgi:hypothetical protein